MKVFAKIAFMSLVIGTTSLMGCQQKSSKDTLPTTASQTKSQNQSMTSASSATLSAASVPKASVQQSTSATAPKNINWQLIESGVKPVDIEQFKYPFALDSIQVKSYMDAYHVDAKTARYNLTTGMAVNEILDKVLDQVDTAYVSHELTAGKDAKFIIHTTAQITPSQHNYVFAEPFAHGLTIPVQIINDGKK